VNRDDFKAIARIRLEEARVLLDNNQFSGAYYLSGYAVECGLKACIAKLTNRYDFPDRKTVDRMYSHDLDNLLDVAQLKRARDEEFEVDRQFRINWGVTKDWTETARYQEQSAAQARDLYNAIADRRHGVLRWIRRQW
jgi:HEPN domain-containing protein